jgi:hypothetical protein
MSGSFPSAGGPAFLHADGDGFVVRELEPSASDPVG